MKKSDTLLKLGSPEEGVELQVALCYLASALEYLDSSRQFGLPKSRRLSRRWFDRLRLIDRRRLAASAGAADGVLCAVPTCPDVASAATDLLVSAFWQSCEKLGGSEDSSDALLDGVITLALQRAHETCIHIRAHVAVRARVVGHGATRSKTSV